MENKTGITKIKVLSLIVNNLKELGQFTFDNVDRFEYNLYTCTHACNKNVYHIIFFANFVCCYIKMHIFEWQKGVCSVVIYLILLFPNIKIALMMFYYYLEEIPRIN